MSVGGRICDKLCDVAIGERVLHLRAVSLGGHEVCAPQHPEVLGNEWLREAEFVHQFVNAAWSFVQPGKNGKAYPVGQRAEELFHRGEFVVMHLLYIRTCA